MITLTIVRHGESTDNLRAVWAGWADAPLSNHGMNQAKALGQSLATTKIDAVFASPLKRALWTGQQIEAANHHRPAFTVSPLLREQHFGVAEQQTFGTSDGNGFFRKPGRTFRFPKGETLEDVRARANEAITQFIEPALQETYGQGPDSKHLIVVAHGIFNFELLGALLSRRPEGIDLHWSYRGMTNTGWTRLEVGYSGEVLDGTPFGADTFKALSRPPPLAVETLCFDVTTHLEGVHRQQGGIGSSGFDEKQSDIRAFFGGAQND